MTQIGEVPTPLAQWNIPVFTGGFCSVQVSAGEVLTILGANGSGKSALASWMPRNSQATAIRRVLAQRKLWFTQSGPSITPADRQTRFAQITHWDQEFSSRYLDHSDSQRSGIALFDMLAKINQENRERVDLYEAGSSTEDVTRRMGPRVLDTFNTVLQTSGLEIEIGVDSTENFFAKHLNSDVTYPIHLMSDGEKSALLLAAEIITAPSGVTFIIDEPERHLHRAISDELIKTIIATRNDCAFVVFTHDLDLAASLSEQRGKVLTVFGVRWEGEQAMQWDLHEIAQDDSLPEIARQAILGGRKEILFIEGETTSHDLSLYKVLFPDWLLVPSGGCDTLIRSVSGLRNSESFHWVRARGLVDGDWRSEQEIESLFSLGIHVLPVSEIENLYYTSEVLQAVAEQQASTFGDDPQVKVEEAKSAAMKALGKNETLERLTGHLSKSVVARKLVEYMPDVVDENAIEINFDSPFPQILRQMKDHLTAGAYDELIKALPIRNTSMRIEIARHLGFQSIQDYETAALHRIRNSPPLQIDLHIPIEKQSGREPSG
ncbi:AAA family ATPase [Glutamicibacter sp. JL.03c]|uniref:AAA family ATPase n=1 Tax=Glutamicibacter sp. JL.03c TaxID=2984842 RepID=UPI0021F6BF93|nr:AAA family ATPase [Glutamicibacter sp. JL.03c]UYQ78223.1 AAA family ATPase [Glutamicibacter sp. JL.03c]